MPYEYLTSQSVLKETCLPPIKNFSFSLGVRRIISQEDYIHAQDVWKTFKCKNFQEYVENYVQLDVLLLGELFSQFKNNCKQQYGLFPESYCTLPSFIYDACIYFLSKQGITIDLLTDMKMIEFVEAGFVNSNITQDFYFNILAKTSSILKRVM